MRSLASLINAPASAAPSNSRIATSAFKLVAAACVAPNIPNRIIIEEITGLGICRRAVINVERTSAQIEGRKQAATLMLRSQQLILWRAGGGPRGAELSLAVLQTVGP